MKQVKPSQEEIELFSRSVAHFLTNATLAAECSDLIESNMPEKYKIKGAHNVLIREVSRFLKRIDVTASNFQKVVYDSGQIEEQLRHSVNMTEKLTRNVVQMTEQQFSMLINFSDDILADKVTILSEEDCLKLNSISESNK